MKNTLQQALVHDFPNLYRLVNEPTPDGTPFSPMKFGFECGDGWEPVIRRLSEKLEPLGIEAHQVKEKFGGLRFYVGPASEEALDLIEEAESLSLMTCEECGGLGNTGEDRGWITTLCDACRKSKAP